MTIISWEGSNNYTIRVSTVAIMEQKSHAVVPHKIPLKQPNSEKGFLKIYYKSTWFCVVVVVVDSFCLWRLFAFSLKC